MLELLQSDGRARAPRLPPGLERVVLALTGPLDRAHLAWLRTHLAALPPPLRLEVGTIGARRAWTELSALEHALERPLRAWPLAGGLDDLDRAGGCLLVALGPIDARDGPVDWALRRARGPVLVVPDRASAPGPWPHVEVTARDAAEVERLAPWAALLPPGASVTLRAPGPPPSESSPARALVEVMVLQRTLRGACERLSDLGVLARAARAFDDALDPGATLLVRAARRGLLRRWWPGPDARRLRRDRRPMLLVPSDRRWG